MSFVFRLTLMRDLDWRARRMSLSTNSVRSPITKGDGLRILTTQELARRQPVTLFCHCDEDQAAPPGAGPVPTGDPTSPALSDGDMSGTRAAGIGATPRGSSGHQPSGGRATAASDVVMLGAALAWLVAIVVATADRLAIASDDAFISFQYARNLARGVGPVFNPGERVWGFTSPLQTLLLGTLTWLGADTVRSAFVCGVSSVAVAAVLLAEVLPRALALCAGLCFLLLPSMHGSYEMESSLLVALQLGCLLAAVTRRARLANLLGGLSCLARPDSLLLVLPILLAGRDTRRPRNLALFAAVGLGWEAFAYAYYGELLPNSLRAKQGLTPFGAFVANATTYLTNNTVLAAFGPATSAPLAGRIALVLLNGALLFNEDLRRRPVLLYALVGYPWLLVGAYGVIGSALGHNWEMYSARFFFQAGATIGLLGALHRAAALRPWRPAWRAPAAAALLLVPLAGGVAQTITRVNELRSADTSRWRGARYDVYRRLAAWMEAHAAPGASVAVSEVGTLAYFSDLRIIDVSGIVTRGHAAGERGDMSRFLQRFAPRYAVVPGDLTELRAGPSLHYRRVAFLPDRGYAAMSLLALEPR